MSLRPIIAIFGTTGVGKSNLAIDLALHISKQKTRWKGARIVNADAMQVYAGLDVLTNKVSEAERHGIDHLLMGFKHPGEQYVVGQWVADATRVIEETHMKDEIPIIVGGTSYWMQHLIFPDRLAGMQAEQPPTFSASITRALASLPPDLLELFNSLPPQPPIAADDPEAAASLHLLLHHLDPAIAARWHWRDTRKVFRSLNIVKDTGRAPSEIISEQSEISLQPRYRTLCLWLYAEPSVLHPRLDTRVDAMIERGLLEEVRSLHTLAQHTSEAGSDPAVDYTLGIYQSIGYKEFNNYLTCSQTDKAYNEAVENMKLSTRQYAKRQISWIRNKLLPAIDAANAHEKVVPTYLLDATDEGQNWASNVRDSAVRLSQDFLNSEELPDPVQLSEIAEKMLRTNDKAVDPNSVLQAQRKIVCSICTVDPTQPFMVDERQLTSHCESRSHKRMRNKKTPEQHREQNLLKRSKRPKSTTDLDGEVDAGEILLFS